MTLFSEPKPFALVAASYQPNVLLTSRKSVTQDGDLLCWAACVVSAQASTRSIARISQYELAKRFIENCDSSVLESKLRESVCDQTVTFPKMTEIWKKTGFKLVKQTKIDSQFGCLLVKELNQKRPVQIATDHGTHAALAFGYRRNKRSGVEEVWLMDPKERQQDGWIAIAEGNWWVECWYELHTRSEESVELPND